MENRTWMTGYLFACRDKEINRKLRIYLFVIFLLPLVISVNRVSAQSADQGLRISYQNNLLTIYARNSDIKDFFSKLAGSTGIRIEYPATIEKKVTLSRKDVSLKKFLASFLRNMNHVVIFSGASTKKSKISEVYIYPDSKKSSLSNIAETRITRRIASYKRAIQSVKSRLSKVSEDSSRGKSYLRQLDRYEKMIQNLENQL